MSGIENNPLPEELVRGLRWADDLTFYSIHCIRNAPPEESDLGTIDGFRILRGTLLERGPVRQKVVDGVLKSHRTFRGKTRKCFFPRHALQMTDGTKTLIALLCYQCGIMQYYVNAVRQNTFFGIAEMPQILKNPII